MRKRIIATLLVFAMIMTLLPSVLAVEYDDVKGHWAESSIVRWTECKVVQGENGRFNADKKLTRAEFAVILFRLLHLPTSTEKNNFDDVVADEWYADAINSCAEAGIMKGSNGHAKPTVSISRAESVTMICRALGIKESSTDILTGYIDYSLIPSYALGYMASASERGIIKGVTENTLAPLSDITRAQMMVILDRAIATYIDQADATVTVGDQGLVLVVESNVTVTGKTAHIVVGRNADAVTLKDLDVSGALTVCGDNTVANVIGKSVVSNVAFGENTENATVVVDAKATVCNAEPLANGNAIRKADSNEDATGISGSGVSGSGGSGSSGGNSGSSAGENKHNHSYVNGSCTECGEVNSANTDRTVVSLNGEWNLVDYDGNRESVIVPHDWEYYSAAAAYNPTLISKTVTYEKKIDVSAYAGKKLFLQFYGVNKVAKVYVDDALIGEHTGGYTAFSMDITDACADKSAVTIKVENTNATFDTMPVNTDFTHFAGIYRDVNLVAVSPAAYISMEDNGSQGVYLTNSVDLNSNTVTLTPVVKISNPNDMAVNAEVSVTLQDASGETVAYGSKTVPVDAKTVNTKVALDNITVHDAHLWQGVDDPYLYTARTTVCVNGAITDTNTQTIGFRTYQVEDGKFYLNGKQYQLHGVGMHQQNNGSYVASNEDVEDAISYVQEMGANALRTSHYPHSQYTYQLCDEKGIVVWSEIPYYLVSLDTDEFRQNVISNLTEMIEQSYNHASIIVWGIQNEVYYSANYARFYNLMSVEQTGEFMKELATLAKTLDPSRLVGEAEIDDSRYFEQMASWTTAESGIDIFGMNIYVGWYRDVNGATEENKRTYIVNDYRNRLVTYHDIFTNSSGGHASFVMTEYGAGGNPSQHDDLGVDFKWGGMDANKGYITSGAYQPEEYQSYVHEGMMMALYGDKTNKIEAADGLWASFAWSLFDFSCYRNEGGKERTNTKGLITADRKIIKDVFYLYKANWNNNELFTHICSSRFENRSSQKVDVKVYSNCDSVDLIVNGISKGEGALQQDGVFVWKDVELNQIGMSNTVQAVGYKDGNRVALDTCDTWVVHGFSSQITLVDNLNKVEDGTPCEVKYKVMLQKPVVDITNDANVVVDWYRIVKSDDLDYPSYSEYPDYDIGQEHCKLIELDEAPSEAGQYMCRLTVMNGSNGQYTWSGDSWDEQFTIQEQIQN